VVGRTAIWISVFFQSSDRGLRIFPSRARRITSLPTLPRLWHAAAVKYLTGEQQRVLAWICLLLVLGLTVKAFRTHRPSASAAAPIATK